MQVYFMLPGFVEAIGEFSPEKFLPLARKQKADGNKVSRKIQATELVAGLQQLHSYLWNSNRKYVPSESVTEKLTDDLGNPIKVGGIGEFNRNFLLRVNEALELEDTPFQDHLDPKESQALGMSVLPPVVSDQLEKTFIYNTFFGSFQVITKAIDKEGDKVELKTTNAFSHVVINPTEDNLYKCWEASYFTDIENLNTPSVPSI